MEPWGFLWLTLVNLSGGARSTHGGWGANDKDKLSAGKRRKLLDKKQCSLFSFQEAVETPCVKGGSAMVFLKEKEGCIDNSKESEVQRSFTNICVIFVGSLCDFLDC